MNDWFTVDKKGLGQLLERRGKSFAVLELISNAWDQNVTRVDVDLNPIVGKPLCRLTVTDDDPDGFADLTHAYTLFAPSTKKSEAEKRGRFNLGEKLVLALCDKATITSTKGAVRFDDGGRHNLRTRRDAGSVFDAVIRLTRAEYDETMAVLTTLIPPAAITTTVNGCTIPAREAAHSFKATLATEIADDEGNLRPSTRSTVVQVFEPAEGETPMIYELGIPVVDSGDRWSYNVMQKVPLNMDRDNVKPAFLRHLRTLVLNEMHDRITEADANATWTKEAIEDPRATGDAVRAVIEKRFGDKVVAYDPSDPEANNLAVSRGYTLVHGKSLSKSAWQNVRTHEVLKPAGQVTPSNSALLNARFSPDGKDITIPEERWTPGQRRVLDYAQLIGESLLGFRPQVELVSDITLPASAWYGGRTLTFNVGKLSHRWFDQADPARVDALLIHEFAHERASNHLDHSFHDECCRLGAALRDVPHRM